MNSSAIPHTFAAHWPKIQLVEAPTRNIIRRTQQRITDIHQADVTNLAPALRTDSIMRRDKHAAALEHTIEYLQSKVASHVDYIGLTWVANMLRHVHPEVDVSYTLQMIIESISIGYAHSLTYEQRQAYEWTGIPDESQLVIQLPHEPLDYAIQKISKDIICQVYARLSPVSSV
jgi:hypothetical protein